MAGQQVVVEPTHPNSCGRTMAAPPPELMDELVEEILLRLPPDEPEHLFRATLVCKAWLRNLCDPAFLRRYRAFHRAPPLLGLLHKLKLMHGDPAHHVAPTTAAPFSPYPDCRPDCRRTWGLDCRHGRILLDLDVGVWGGGPWNLIVWDPVTGDRHSVPNPQRDWLIYSAMVFCAVPGCDHLDCHGGPFGAVTMTTDDHEELVTATVYSSETGAWSMPVSLNGTDCEAYAQHMQVAREKLSFYYIPYVQPRRGAVIGDGIYFMLWWRNTIVKYDLGKNCFSMINPPIPDEYGATLMAMDDGSLGFAFVEGSKLYLWSRKVNSDGDAGWVQCKAIELATIVPVDSPSDEDEPLVVGSAEGVGVIFVCTGASLFAIEIKSEHVSKVDGPGGYFSVLPYMSFYTPDRGRLLSLAKTS